MVAFEAPDAAELADRAAGWRSAYVHIPFCARICPYCDFAVVAGRDEAVPRYLAGLRREIGDEPDWGELDAIYIGGGTPTRVPAEEIARLLGALRRRFGLVAGAEVTVEANPEDWSETVAGMLAEAGCNRVSFGAQSFEPRILKGLGRAHTPDQIDAAVGLARRAGFGSVSLDLIYGTPGETTDGWSATLGRALAVEPDHISAYALTVERGTVLSRSIRAGAPGPDPDLQADMWELADRTLAAAGFARYEVSNHARLGHHCRYNLSVWAGGEYLAFGAGAHGYRDGSRRRNVRRLDAYLERVERGIGPVQAVEPVEGWSAEQERLLLGLRRTAGVELGPAGEALLASEEGRRLREAGVIAEVGERLRVLRPLLTDEVSRAVLGLAAPA